MQEGNVACIGDNSDTSVQAYHLGDVFAAYGYGYNNANENLAMLLDYAGAFDTNYSRCLLEDFAFKGKNNVEDFVQILDQLHSQEARKAAILFELGFEDFTDAHNYLIRITQQLFFNRSGERWDSKIPQWISDNLEEVMIILKDMHSCDEILPTEKEYDCVAVFGASSYEMDKRLKFVYSLKEEHGVNFDYIFLLTGQRYVDPRVDSNYLIETSAIHFNIDSLNVTEAHLMEKMHLEYSVGNKMVGMKYFVIDSMPRGGRDRPTTRDTIEDFVNDPNFEQCNSVIFVSKSPNIYAQGEDVHKLMPRIAPEVQYEVIGGKCKYDETLPLNAAYHDIMPIAGALYGGWERVEQKVIGKVNLDRKFVKPSENCAIKLLDRKLGVY